MIIIKHSASKLTKHDYIVLEYVCQHPASDEQDIIAALKNKVSGISFRLTQLSTSGISPKANGNIRIIEAYLARTSYANTQVYSITSRGEATLQDHFVKKKTESRNRIIAISTLILSAITAVASVIAALK